MAVNIGDGTALNALHLHRGPYQWLTRSIFNTSLNDRLCMRISSTNDAEKQQQRASYNVFTVHEN